MNRRVRMAAILMAAVVLVMPLTCIAVVSDDDDDVDGNPVAAAGWGARAAAYLAKHWKEILFLVTGIQIGWDLNEALSPDEGTDADQLRRDEAIALSAAFVAGFPSIANAMANYTNIWGLTQEHWTRQAELTSSIEWTKGASYSPYAAMTLSSTYYNSAVMLVNATAQINELLDTISEHIGSWNGSDVSQYYGDGKMLLKVSVGGSSVSADSSDSFHAALGSIVGSGNDRVVAEGRNAVYFVGGPVWASSSAVMTGANGNVIHLQPGWNVFPDGDSWDGYNVYRLTPGVQYFGNFMYVLESDAAPTQTGLFVSGGDGEMIVTCDGTRLYDGSGIHIISSGGSLNISVVPQNREDARSEDITAMLVNYAGLNSEIDRVIAEANRCARTVWGCYDSAGSASEYLTTLTVPDTYMDVELTDAQKRMIVSLSMDQLSSWWLEHDGEIKSADYRMTQDSLSLYCLGDITVRGVGSDGGMRCKVYEGVAFTPVFYRSMTLENGRSNTLDTHGFVLVYGQRSSLSGFEAVDYDDCELVFVGSGSVLGISEMRYGGEYVDSVNLKSTEVDWIDADDMGDWGTPTPSEDDGIVGIIRLVLVLLGAALLVYGAVRGRPVAIIAGIALIGVGWFLAEPIETMIERWTDARWLMPW